MIGKSCGPVSQEKPVAERKKIFCEAKLAGADFSVGDGTKQEFSPEQNRNDGTRG
jgi:hypothetical protein